MAHVEQVKEIMDLIEKSKLIPKKEFCENLEFNKGYIAVIKFLFDNDGRRTAGQISEFMHFSTARTAAILSKLEEKHMIIKEANEYDKRVTVVVLSEEGYSFARKMKEKLHKKISLLIDKLGMEKIYEFHQTMSIVREIMNLDENIESEKK